MRNLPCNVQTETEAVGRVGSGSGPGTSLKRLEDAMKGGRRDHWAAVPHLDQYVRVPGHDDYPYDRRWLPILDCISDKVAYHLLDPAPIAAGPGVSCYFQFHLLRSVRGPELVQFIFDLRCNYNRSRYHPNTKTKLRPVEIAHVIEQSLHPLAAPDQSGRGGGNVTALVKPGKMVGGHLDGLQGTAHVMPEHAEEQVA
jgi:hypothetical protein